MNGRVYDPEIGRFLSADPMVQFPDSTQGYDRYQYVNNNPLSATDPSGYFSDDFNEILGGVVAIAVGSVTGGIASGLLGPGLSAHVAGGMIGGAMAGFAVQPGGGAASTTGAIGGGMAGAIGYGYDTGRFGLKGSATALSIKSILHGISQGALSDAGGGRFSDGFLGGATSSLVGPLLGKQDLNPVVEALIAAIIGGSVSEMGGGKFVNGAASGAFVNLFNEQAESSTADDAYSKKTALRRYELAVQMSVELKIPLTLAVAKVWLAEAGARDAWTQLKAQKKFFYKHSAEQQIIEAEHYLYAYSRVYLSAIPVLAYSTYGGLLTPGYQAFKYMERAPPMESLGYRPTNSPPTRGQLYWDARGATDAYIERTQ